MKKTQILIIGIMFLLPFSVSQIYAQTLYVDARVGDMDQIEESNYRASGLTVVRSSDGDLISVVRVEGSRYLNDPITEQFLNSDPKLVVKKGIINDEMVTMYKVEVDYNNPKCLEQLFDVPGYSDPCAWYHRAFVTMLGVNDSEGELYYIFKGLNHTFTIKSLDTIKTTWHILSKD